MIPPAAMQSEAMRRSGEGDEAMRRSGAHD